MYSKLESSMIYKTVLKTRLDEPELVLFVFNQERSRLDLLPVDNVGTEDKPLKIPKEVWLLVDHLFTKACRQVGQ